VKQNAEFQFAVVVKTGREIRICRRRCGLSVTRRHKRATPPGSIRASVENEARLLPHGRAQAETVAKALAVSPRTLSRRLSDEGTTFAEVIEQLRRSLATQYLSEPGFTLTQIGWLSGYEGPTSFNRAFKRWTDRPPSAARNQARFLRSA
jgi:AraC-like DNA-binding protein